MTKPFCALILLVGTYAFGQNPATMKQLMLDLIHPAANDLLLVVSRGGPQNEAEWATARRSALTLAESGDGLAKPRRGIVDPNWEADVKLLADAGAAAYQAAKAKDAKALAATAGRIDASCTTCHKQFRPDVFPRQGGSQ